MGNLKKCGMEMRNEEQSNEKLEREFKVDKLTC